VDKYPLKIKTKNFPCLERIFGVFLSKKMKKNICQVDNFFIKDF